MCGIIGIIDNISSVVDKGNLINMKNTLAHRGPDENNVYIDKNIGLAHTRLSIIDKESGKQPMEFTYNGETYVIVYNGELYNTKEIREKLSDIGIRFNGYSDTEAVLKSYAAFKEKCLNMFNGIFAFAVYEKNAGKLFLARDRIGVKPLFYYCDKYRFCFSSEIKGILAHKDIKAELDTRSLEELFLIQPGRSAGYGIFKGVKELKPACYMVIENINSNPNQVKYWNVKASECSDSFERVVEKTRFLLKDSIIRQLVSDVPVGTFLSGGIDSSIVSSVANEEMKKQGKILRTFSLDYEDNDKYFKKSFFQPSNDTEYIYRMQQYLNCRSYWCILNVNDLISALYDAVDARDYPGMADIDSSMLLLCKNISQNVKAAVSGECADELFGGYPWYRKINTVKNKVFPWSDCIKYRHSFLKEDFREIIDPDKYVERQIEESLSEISVIENESLYDKKTREMIHLNTDWFMQNLLERKDRMSMANSLEVRVPFCDYRLVEYLYNIPWKYKNYNGYEKGLLRKCFEDYLPDEVLWRKKSPFPKTHHPVYLDSVSKILTNIIENNESPLLKIADKKALTNLIRSDDDVSWYGQLMKKPQIIAYFIQMNYWLEKYNITLSI